MNPYDIHFSMLFLPAKQAFSIVIELNAPVTFVKEFNDDDYAQIFIDTLEKNIKHVYKTFKFPKSMIMTMHDTLDNSTLCHICNEELGEDRVRDHCHLSGKSRGAAHEVCNLKYKVSKFSQLYFTICLPMIVTYLLKLWEIAKEIFLVFQIMKDRKSTRLNSSHRL